MKITELPHWWTRPADKQAEMDSIVAEMKLRYPPKPRPIKPDGMSDEDFILSLQTPTTRMVMQMTPEQLEERRNRPMPTMEQAAANKEAFEAYKKDPSPENWKKMVGARDLTPDEISHFEAVRRRSKNTLGQSEKSSVSEESRERGIDAMIFTPPAKVTKQEVEARAVNLTRIESKPMTEVWVEMNWYQAMIHWLKGNKVRRDNK